MKYLNMRRRATSASPERSSTRRLAALTGTCVLALLTPIGAGSASAAVDLRLDLADDRDPVSLGQDVTYTTSVVNDGRKGARSVRVTQTLPSGASLVSARTGGRDCSVAGSGVRCDLGTLDASRSAIVTVVLRPTAFGTLTTTASAATTSSESSTANNAKTETTNVLPANEADVLANPVDWTPHVLDGYVRAIVQVGSKIFIGGTFTQVQDAQGATHARQNIAAFDAQTGLVDPAFAPAVDKTVEDIVAAPDGNVLVGGSFATVNGVSRFGLVKLDADDGSTVPGFTGFVQGTRVSEMTVRGNRLFVGGQFWAASRVKRPAFAALDATTGAYDHSVAFAFAGARSTARTTSPLALEDLALSPDGSRLVVTGSFSTVNGAQRDQVAMFDIAPEGAVSLSTWATDRFKPQCYDTMPAYLRDVDWHPSGDWFGIVTSGGYGAGPPTLCDTASRWDGRVAGGGQNPAWVDYTGGDSLFSIEISQAAVYVGGHQRWHNNPNGRDAAGPGAIAREGLAALDPASGFPLAWNPGRSRGIGVEAMLSTPQGLWLGSDTTRLAWEFHGRLGLFPPAAPAPAPAAS